jgi:hypothetical protein
MRVPRWLLRLWCSRFHRPHCGIAPDGWHWVCQVDSFEWEFSARDVLACFHAQEPRQPMQPVKPVHEDVSKPDALLGPHRAVLGRVPRC